MIELVRQILSRATRAPSGDNCQPLRFELASEKLSVFHVPARGRHRLNMANSASLLAIGALLESIVIAASEYSLEARVESLWSGGHGGPSNNDEGTGPWARITFRPSNTAKDALAEALESRCTDRRLYQSGELPQDLLQKILETDQAAVPNARVHYLPAPLPKNLTDFICHAETFVVRDVPAMTDFLHWLRFDPKSAHETRDGMPAGGLGIKFHQVAMLKLMRKFPAIIPLIMGMGMPMQQRMAIGKQLRHSAGIVCISVPSAEQRLIMEAGRLAQRAWLRLNQAGFGVQPLTMSSLPVFNAKLGVLSGIVSPEWIEFYRSGEPVLRNAFGLGESELPVWILRTGRTVPFPKEDRTHRLELDRLLTVSPL